jgi:hypothetical protein
MACALGVFGMQKMDTRVPVFVPHTPVLVIVLPKHGCS